MYQEIKAGKDHTFVWEFYSDNIAELPVGGNITVYKNTGTVLIAETPVTINTAGVISYTLPASATSDEDRMRKNYKIELEYYVNQTTNYRSYLFDVVQTPITNDVRDDDLFLHLSELRSRVQERTIKTSSAGTTTTIIADALKTENRNYRGGLLDIFKTNAPTHHARITAHNEETNTLTFDPPNDVIVADETTIRIRDSFQDLINEAYENFVHRDVRNKVPASAGYINNNILRNMVIFKSLEIYSLSASEETDDKWAFRLEKFAAMYEKEFSKLSEAYDITGDGDISDEEEANKPNANSVSIYR